MVDTKKILWDNVYTLMIMKYGRENLRQTAEDSGVGPGTMTRIKQQETSTGVDTLEKLAKLFKVEVWQLLVPGIGQQELRVMQHMKSMCDDQKDTIATISYSLAQPKAKYGNEK
jgi:transcriptional regulator with XRE-family HTH domain